jgi:hypothetical protein
VSVGLRPIFTPFTKAHAANRRKNVEQVARRSGQTIEAHHQKHVSWSSRTKVRRSCARSLLAPLGRHRGLFVGLDVSLKMISICIVEEDGTPIWQGKALSEPPDAGPISERYRLAAQHLPHVHHPHLPAVTLQLELSKLAEHSTAALG